MRNFRENTWYVVCTNSFSLKKTVALSVGSINIDHRVVENASVQNNNNNITYRIHENTNKKVSFCEQDERGSTIGEGGDTTISSPGRSPEQPLPRIELYDPLHGWQSCPDFIAFDQGIGQICAR